MGQSRPNEDPRYEAEGADGAGFFGLDLEGFLSELLGPGAPFGWVFQAARSRTAPRRCGQLSPRVRAKASRG